VIIRLEADGTPPYHQIRDQLRRMIISGTLPVGTRLPAIRHLATDLDVAKNTVGRAYAELEAEGLVVGAGRRGTIVVEPNRTAGAEPPASFVGKLEELALEARHRGLAIDVVVDQLRSAFRHLESGDT